MKKIICLGLIFILIMNVSCKVADGTNDIVNDVERTNDIVKYVSENYQIKESLIENERELWDSTIGQVLQEDLWTSRDMYDACHYLMVPMHFAFESNDAEFILQFKEFFERFTSDVVCGDDVYNFYEGGVLNKLHFCYLVSEYILLCELYDLDGLYSEELYGYVREFSEELFYNSTGPWVATKETGIEERILNIINGKEYDYPVWATITDLDTFPLAILCDLKTITILKNEPVSYAMHTASELVYEIFTNEDIIVYTENGGFIIQPGVFATHADAAYAGNETIYDGIEPKIKEDYVSDTSHFQRMPLFLHSFMLSQDTIEQAEFFEEIINKLANQLIIYVLQKIEGKWLLTTFMDGTNGVYRYSTNTIGVGHEMYSLSGTFLLGWWSFLEDERVTSVYEEILDYFPLSGNVQNPYFDYATIREQNPYFDADTSYDNGYMELLVMLAGK